MKGLGQKKKGSLKKDRTNPSSSSSQGGAGNNKLDFDDFLNTLDDDDEGSSASDNEGSSDEDDPVRAVSNGNSHPVNKDGDSDDEDAVDEEEDEEGDSDEGDDDEEEEDEEVTVDSKGEEQGSDNDDEEGDKEESEEEDEMTVTEHKEALQRLQSTDPDFFDFLQQNDANLLNFDDSDDGASTDDDDEMGGPIHRPPEELEEASDSEAEEERVDMDSEDHQQRVAKFVAKGVVNLEVMKEWEQHLTTSKDLGIFTNVIEAFECAVRNILEDEEDVSSKWKVEGSGNFNALVRLCIKCVKSFCVRYLCGGKDESLTEHKFDQRPMEFKEKNNQKWKKLRAKIKAYMTTLTKFLKSMGNSDAVASTLRHCHKMAGFWALLGPKSYKLLKVLVNIWSSGEDSCRVLAFLAIMKMTNYNREAFLLRVYKQMYLSYVANCKFTSANNWPALNLMRSSLTEIYLLDPGTTYSVAFPFIRQLAIHLRNALTAGTTFNQQTKNKKEASRIVYSWQFVHSLNLWADVLAHSGSTKDENLKLLMYPLIQICLGTIKLIPTKKYIPLRFFVIRMLIKIQDKTGVFIPILPLIMEALLMTDFSPKTISTFSVRPLDLTCCLKADVSESGYAKAITETVFELILRSCKAIATELSFPEIVTPTLMQLRSFLKKKCKNPEVCRKFRTLIEKMDANSKYISDKRSKALESGTVSLADVDSQKVLRVQMETTKPHPPILEFATQYLKTNATAQAKARRTNVQTREEKLIPKPSASQSKKKMRQEKASTNILDSDSDEEADVAFKTKLDENEVEVENTKSKVKANRKRKSEAKGVSKMDKTIKKKKRIEPEIPDVEDELVDFQLSD